MFLPSRVHTGIGRVWHLVRSLFDMLFLIRFSVVLGVSGIVVFLAVPQGREILRHLSAVDHPLHAAWFLVATLVCAGSTWYCARLLFDWEGAARFRTAYPWLCDWLPRLLGASIPVAFATRLQGVVWLQIVLVVASLLFLGFVTGRRAMFRLGPRNIWRSTRELSTGAKRYFVISLLSYVTALILFSFAAGQHVVAPSLGAGTVVLLGLGLLIPLGAMLVYAGQVKGFPFLGALLVWGIGISGFSDNHDVRRLDGTTGIASHNDLGSYYRAWRDDLLQNTSGDVPVYVVCAEGGGIRAAYWTALVLGHLQDRSRDGSFARHVFAISGVSGGSLGASLFAAQLASPSSATQVPRARAMLETDALSPTLASFVFGDLFQRVLPFALFHDRAEALETAWERAWRQANDGDDRFAAPMDALWEGDPFAVPLLFLNSTVVESGNRIILQPVILSPDAFDRTFRQANDARTILGGPVRLSTAALMSARFTYVSPAGSIERQDEAGRWIRVVDGGYFENSGAVTAEEILGTMLEVENETPSGRIRLVQIHISNDPRRTEAGRDDVTPRETHRVRLGEALSPLRALLNTRSARGYQAREHLWQEIRRIPDSRLVHFWLRKDAVELPLGWLLSDAAFDEMDRQLERLDENQTKVRLALGALEQL